MEQNRTDRIPDLYVLVGLPGSGKSTFADEYAARMTKQPVVHSSDKLREEIFNNVDCQNKNQELFTELHRRIKNDLINGNDVIYDATNIKKNLRVAFLKELKNISCYKKCVVFMTTYETCLENNANRDRKVPEEVIKRMYMNWTPPNYSEGFDRIDFLFNYGHDVNRMKYTLHYLFSGKTGLNNFDQKNSHHSRTLGEHCQYAHDYAILKWPGSRELHMAALLHDIGKVQTQTKLNGKGEEDGNYHYFQHHCVSAYESLFYLDIMCFQTIDMVYVSNLIYYHMHPYISWKQSEKAANKDRMLIGEAMYNDVMRLHEADLNAH